MAGLIPIFAVSKEEKYWPIIIEAMAIIIISKVSSGVDVYEMLESKSKCSKGFSAHKCGPSS